MNLFFKNFTVIVFLVLGLILTVPSIAYAQGSILKAGDIGSPEFITEAEQSGIADTAYAGGIGDIFITIINVVYFIGLAIALIFIIVCGIKYMTSQGDQQKAEEARSCITNAVIGVVIIVAFRVILTLLIRFITGGTEGLGDANFFTGGGGATPVGPPGGPVIVP